MTNTAAAVCLSGCLYVLDTIQAPPFIAAFVAMIIGYYIGKFMTREVKHERRAG